MVTINSAQTETVVPVETMGRGVTDINTGTTRNYLLMRSYLSWGSIIAGSALAISLLILSASLAYACGVQAYSGGAYAWGAGVWSVIASAVAFFCGGCLASYFASAADGRFRFLHGVMVWGLTLPVLAFTFLGAGGLWVSHAGLVTGASSTGPMYASTGAAWAAFLSLMIGLICASIGGARGSTIHEQMLMGSR